MNSNIRIWFVCGVFMNYCDIVEMEVKKRLNNTKNSHDWDHTMRVYKVCIKIGTVEKADLEILKLAALLHDIGREEEDRLKGDICHAEIGAKMAVDILKKCNIDDCMINKIYHCIETHRFKGLKKPLSLAAKILFDADKLDAIGAIGLARAFVFAGEIGAKVHNSNIDIEKTKPYSEEDTAYREYYFKLRKIKDSLFTETGREMAEERHRFMVEFFERLDLEVCGGL